MSDTPRNITGVFKTPAGAVVSNKTLTWFRAKRETLSQGTSVIVDEPFFVQTDASGEIDTNVIPGLYLVLVKLSDADRFFAVGVPEGEGGLNIADLVETYAPPVTPEDVQLAKQYRDEALAARDDAQAAQLSIEERYLGVFATAPTEGPGGAPLIDGALYWNTASKKFFVYNLGATTWEPTTFRFRGDWDNVTAFLVGDIARLPDAGTAGKEDLWLALQDNTDVSPTEGATWTLFLPGVGLSEGSVEFVNLAASAVASEPEAVGGTADDKLMTPERSAQQIDGRATKLHGTDSLPRTMPQRIGDVVDLDDWLTGDGTTNNDAALAALITYMGSNKDKVFRSRKGRDYLITGIGFVIPSEIKLRLEGARFTFDTDALSGANLFTLEDDCDVDALRFRITAGHTIYRGINLEHRVRADVVEFIADSQQANNDNSFYRAVRVNGSECDIGFLHVENFDRGALVFGSSAEGVNEGTVIRRTLIKSYRQAMQARNCRYLTLFDHNARGRSPNGLPDPGENGLLLEGVERSRFIGGSIEDSPEHGFRSGGFRDAETGTGAFVGTTQDLEIVGYTIRSAGQSGFKIWSGDITQTHRNIDLAAIQCIDCGDDGDGLAFNDFGFMLQNIWGLNAQGLSVRARDNTYSAYDSMYLSGLTQSVLGGVALANGQRNNLRISQWNNNGADAQAFNTVRIDGLQMANSGAGQCYIEFSSGNDVRDLMIPNASLVGGTHGFETNAGTGEFPQPSYISAMARGLSGNLFEGTGAIANLKTVDLMAA